MTKHETETPNLVAPEVEENYGENQRIEFDLLLEEYKVANARLTRELDMEEKGFEFLFIAIGGTVVAMTFILEQSAFFLMLLLALPFHLLTWKQARRIIWTAQLVSVRVHDIANMNSSEKAHDIANTKITLPAPGRLWGHALSHKETAWTTKMNSGTGDRQSVYG